MQFLSFTWLRNPRSFFLLLLLGLAGCSAAATPAPQVPAVVRPTFVPTQNVPPPTSADVAILDMLQNIQRNGYNDDSAINQGMGGLWINWRYGSIPLQVNLNDTGDPDGSEINPPRHDLLTDLRYVHALWIYKNLHPSETHFDEDIKRFTTILKQEQSGISHNMRGWVYDEVIDIFQLSKDPFYQQLAQNLASYFFSSMYHPQAGMIYSVNAQNPRGYYRVDLALEAACALIQAGSAFNQSQWSDAGHRVIQQLYATAYVSDYHIFLNQLDDIVLSDGSLNPNPSIFRGKVKDNNIEGGQVRMGAAAQEILSLLHVYSVTKDKTFLDHATDILDRLTADPNTLGLWDSKNQGYFAAFIFPGPDMQHLGTPRISQGYKEAGRQLQMLEAFRIANVFTNNRYQSMQNTLMNIALNKAYLPAGHGVPYQLSPDWQIITLKNGKRLDWVTTEAMGIAIESLASTLRSDPW
jgi:hypothetical protein